MARSVSCGKRTSGAVGANQCWSSYKYVVMHLSVCSAGSRDESFEVVSNGVMGETAADEPFTDSPVLKENGLKHFMYFAMKKSYV